jgi:hypothetical protein
MDDAREWAGPNCAAVCGPSRILARVPILAHTSVSLSLNEGNAWNAKLIA